jgi:hypothetical protein
MIHCVDGTCIEMRMSVPLLSEVEFVTAVAVPSSFMQWGRTHQAAHAWAHCDAWLFAKLDTEKVLTMENVRATVHWRIWSGKPKRFSSDWEPVWTCRDYTINTRGA